MFVEPILASSICSIGSIHAVYVKKIHSATTPLLKLLFIFREDGYAHI
jgi:hypothetical protein